MDRTEVPRHVGLVVSGGHTLLMEVSGAGDYKRLGTTRDDAAGEAFDKVGKMLGLPYPGGPEIEKAAKDGDPTAFSFPRSMMGGGELDFSFSGLKTAVLYTLQKNKAASVEDIAASFQLAVVEVLVEKTIRAAKAVRVEKVGLSGGVSLNQVVRKAFAERCCKGGLGTLHSRCGGLHRQCRDDCLRGFAEVFRRKSGWSRWGHRSEPFPMSRLWADFGWQSADKPGRFPADEISGAGF